MITDSLMIADQDYSEGGLTRIRLDQCIPLLVVLLYHLISVVSLLLMLISWFPSFLSHLARNSFLLLLAQDSQLSMDQ